jgi:hypothetical protein
MCFHKATKENKPMHIKYTTGHNGIQHRIKAAAGKLNAPIININILG